jgi:hypothetical protein
MASYCEQYYDISLESSGMYCRIVKEMFTDVSEVRTAFIIRGMNNS